MIESGDKDQEYEDGQTAMFAGLKGSLLSDSISYTQSPMLDGDHSEAFSPKGDANAYFGTLVHLHFIYFATFISANFICNFFLNICSNSHRNSSYS